MSAKAATRSTARSASKKQGGFGPLALFAAARSPIRFLRREGFVKGILGGSNGWTTVAATLWFLRLVGKMLGKNEEIIATEKLTAGQFVSIRSIPPQTRTTKRRAERDAQARARQAALEAKQAKADARLAKANAKAVRKLARA